MGAGELAGLLGPHGAGKTTAISMISGLLRPDAGKVTVDGADFWSDPPRAQKIMGVVPQEVALYEELSGRENLEFWGRLAGLPAVGVRGRAGEVLEALSLADRARDAVKHYSVRSPTRRVGSEQPASLGMPARFAGAASARREC